MNPSKEEIDEIVEKVSVLVNGVIYRHTFDLNYEEGDYIAREIAEKLLRKHVDKKQEEPF
jgi:hypothetical protein